MSRTITIDIFNPASVDAAVKDIRDYSKWVQKKTKELSKRLAAIGVTLAAIEYSRVPYHGLKDVNLSIEVGAKPNQYDIVAAGETVLILEFGAGVTYGYGHPQPSVEGTPMGPGTYPSEKGHWDDPKGWYIPGGEHTYGNPPSMAMYLTAKELRNRLLEVVQEVFSS
jgi:hypothetical protein